MKRIASLLPALSGAQLVYSEPVWIKVIKKEFEPSMQPKNIKTK